MPAEILTSDDLREFRIELIEEFKRIISSINEESKTAHLRKHLKSSEVRALLNLSPNSLRNLRVKRVLPFTKINGTIYYDRADIEQMIAHNKKAARVKP